MKIGKKLTGKILEYRYEVVSTFSLTLMIFMTCISAKNMSDLSGIDETMMKNNRSKSEMYLELYGYLDKFTKHHSRSEKQDAIRLFQHFNSIRETGKLNRKTLKKMTEPRCSVPDMEHKYGRRFRRYSGIRSKWNKPIVTWGIKDFSRKFQPLVQWKTFRKAFQVWSKHSPLRFLYRRIRPDIQIKFARGEHGDGWYNAFDGKGMTLAHAFRPNSGDTHFDEDEDWLLSSKSDSGVNLLAVAIHELGHAIGMEHLPNKDAIMFPYFKTIRLDLHADDKRQLQSLYGSKKRHKTVHRYLWRRRKPTPRIVNATGVLDGCTGINDLFLGSDGYAHVFAKTTLFKVKRRGQHTNSPVRIRSQYYRAPTNIDAAINIPVKKSAFFFKGSRVWKMTNFMVDPGYPKIVRLPGRERPRAAVTIEIERLTRIYIFGKYYFWEWSLRSETMSRKRLLISKYWRGVPNAPEAALQWRDNYLYFIKGEKYYKVDHRQRRVMPGYPKAMPAPFLRGLC